MFSAIKNKQNDNLGPKKKKSFSLLTKKHVRSQSANSNSTASTSENTMDSNVNVNRGWLESSGVQVTPSRSSEIYKPTTSTLVNLRKPIISDVSQQDILGAVSDEDIFKLTEITSKLPEISTSTSSSKQHHHHHHRNKRQSSSNKDSIPSPPEPKKETITIPDPVSDESAERSWLYKSTTSEAEAIANDFYQKQQQQQLSRIHSINVGSIINKKRHGRSHTSHLTMTNNPQQLSSKRRHSIDTFTIDDTKKLVLDLNYPEVDLHNQEEINDDDASMKAIIEDTDTPLIEIQETMTVMFDYFSLPKEIKELLDIYEHKGKVERKKMTVKYKRNQDDNNSSVHFSFYEDYDDDDDDDDNEDEEEDEDSSGPNTVSYRDLIIGGHDKINYKSNPERDIAILTTTIADNIEFTKLIQLETSSEQGPLLDLHVSMFTDDKNDAELINTDEEFADMLQNIDQKLRAVKSFKKESEIYLKAQLQALKPFNLIHSILPQSSLYQYSSQDYQVEEPFPIDSLSTSSIRTTNDENDYESIPIEGSSSSLQKKRLIKKTKDPFVDRREEIERMVKTQNSAIVEFTSSLEQTENLVSKVQLDMDDFRNRMETYIKDIPESHYSALKKLEVDIESILLKRAKNPWLDTGYALLSYLLTLFALIVWIIICILKLFRKTVLFPRKLWKDYSDYLAERNELVKDASVRSVSAHSLSTLSQQQASDRITMKPTSSLFKRKSTFYPKKI